jgi:hypothetical protein
VVVVGVGVVLVGVFGVAGVFGAATKLNGGGCPTELGATGF